MGTYVEQMSQILRPVAPPRVLEGVYTDVQHERMLDVIKRKGPWRTIMAQHFDTIDELMATSNATLVCIALAERKAVPVPAAFRERIAAFEQT